MLIKLIFLFVLFFLFYMLSCSLGGPATQPLLNEGRSTEFPKGEFLEELLELLPFFVAIFWVFIGSIFDHPTTTHRRKSAQEKKKSATKSATQNSQKIKFKKKKSRPNVGNSKKSQNSNCQQAKSRRYLVFYKERGYMSLVGPSK